MDGTQVSRRALLAGTGVLAAAAVGVVTGATPALAASSAAPAQPLLASRFAPLTGRGFVFTAQGCGTVLLVLAAVEGVDGAQAGEHTFALRFTGPAAARPGGEVGRLHGPGLRPARLLVVPSGRARAGRQDWVATVVGTTAS